jgi:hypothetical protein
LKVRIAQCREVSNYNALTVGQRTESPLLLVKAREEAAVVASPWLARHRLASGELNVIDESASLAVKIQQEAFAIVDSG